MPSQSTLPDTNRYLHHLAPTPLVRVQLGPARPVIWCKLEFMNPSGSTKDRIAGFILEKAWRSGKIHASSHVMEASSGSTSIAMALACAQLGLRFTAVMPEGVSNERSKIIRVFGGQVIFSPREKGVRGAMELAESRAQSEEIFLPRQFENPDNVAAHRTRTAVEMLGQIPCGCVHAIVSGVGTGGTLVGLYLGLKDHGCPVIPVAAKPVVGGAFSDVECCSFSSRIPGVVDGMSKLFRPDELPDLEILEIDDSLALDTCRKLMQLGFPVGPSSGLNYAAAERIATKLGDNANVATVFPDRMERYFSTELFAHLDR